MPTPKPLTPDQASRTLAHRLGRRADRLRQFSTRFGVRPYRTFLVWSKWTGNERGEGDESILARLEILPTPRLLELNGVTYRPWSGGTFPEGTVRIDRISVDFSSDNLRGLVIPQQFPASYYSHRRGAGELVGGTAIAPRSNIQRDFWWEVCEDGRTGDPCERQRYRILGKPWRDAGNAQWIVMLEATSDEPDRAGEPRVADNDVLDGDDE